MTGKKEKNLFADIFEEKICLRQKKKKKNVCLLCSDRPHF